jgi:hypothetical protein
MTRERIKTVAIIVLVIVIVFQVVMRKSDQNVISDLAKSHADLHTAVEGARDCIANHLPSDMCRKMLNPPSDDTDGWLPK